MLFTLVACSDSNNINDGKQQRTVITLGGMWITAQFRNEVIRFNDENPDYLIEIVDYNDGNPDENIALFRTEMIAGKGPDIIVETPTDRLLPDSFYTDLYTYIDSDIVLNRTDFFPNVLYGIETQNGMLPFITSDFTISTMTALRVNADKLNPLTFNSILNRLDEVGLYSFNHSFMVRKGVLRDFLFSSGNVFIDMKNRQANLDSEPFINVLEIISRLPDELYDEYEYFDNAYAPLRRMLNGEQLLLKTGFGRHFYSYMIQRAVLGDVVAVGVPGSTGGQHLIHLGLVLGINANSPHKDVAWNFIRRFLLPDTDFTNTIGIPLRIDEFEKAIAEWVTPQFATDLDIDNPDLGGIDSKELPLFSNTFQNGDTFHVYSMTANEVSEIKSIIENAIVLESYNNIIWEIVEEEIQAFFSGRRSAEDTVRVIQNRVQTYLNELS